MGRKSKTGRSQTGRKSNLTKAQLELDEIVDKLLRISTVPQQVNVQKALENQHEIYQLTEKVKKLEKTSGSDDGSATSERIANFLHWARENGACLNGCSIQEFNGYGLGIRAEVDIDQSTLVIAVPRTLMMSVETAKESALKELMEKDKILSSMPNVALAILLLLEKYKERSFWKSYIDLLPRSYTTVLFFTMEDLEELKGSPTLEVALRQIKSIARQYAYFKKLFRVSNDAASKVLRDHFTYSDYCWAVSTVMTRQNTIPFQEDYHALIPIWDLCNHTNGTISTAYNPLLDRSECLALRSFKAGEQLFIFYGSRSNADLFIHNGFVFEENAYDALWIKLGVSRADPLQEKRTRLLSKLSITNMGDFSLKKPPSPVNGPLLAFLRVFNMDESHLDHWLASEKPSDLEYFECALNTELELKALNYLKNRLLLLEMSYKTSLEQDEELLKAADGAPNQMLAVRMRATEKRIIKATLHYVEQQLKQ